MKRSRETIEGTEKIKKVILEREIRGTILDIYSETSAVRRKFEHRSR